MTKPPDPPVAPMTATPPPAARGTAQPARVSLRLDFAADVRLGPGKVALLEGIRDTGSISAAGRRMKMSYKRAWGLVEALNAAAPAPLVDSARGGAGGGGARLTEAGAAVVAHYRALEALATADGQARIAALGRLLCDMSNGK